MAGYVCGSLRINGDPVDHVAAISAKVSGVLDSPGARNLTDEAIGNAITSLLKRSDGYRKIIGTCFSRRVNEALGIDGQAVHGIEGEASQVNGKKELRTVGINLGHKSIAPTTRRKIGIVRTRKIGGLGYAADECVALPIDRDGLSVVGSRAAEIGRIKQRVPSGVKAKSKGIGNTTAAIQLRLWRIG